jgi:uncharacterized protein
MLTEDEILLILNEWNYWDKDFEDFSFRTLYDQKFRNIRDSGEIIVLTGIRRGGKSTLLKQEMKLLSNKYSKKQFLYVNFEDSRFIGELDSKLLERIFEVYKKHINSEKETILFFDEIQNVENWEKYIRTIYELRKAKIYITGSSSKMLSRELATSIAGRYIEIKVYPLTFSEYLHFKKIIIKSKIDIINQRINIKKQFDNYLLYGGFPRIALSNNLLFIKEELNNYFTTILIKDVVSRYNLKKPDNLKKTAHFIISNDTNLMNLNSIKKYLDISYESVGNFIGYFKEIFLLHELKSFSYSLKKQYKSNSKYYTIDTGLINTNSFKFSDNKGSLLENITLNQLIKNVSEVYYFIDAKSECDFVVKNGNKINLVIQVCYYLNKENKKREINGLMNAMKYFKLNTGIILTYDQEEKIIIDKKIIKVIPIWKWLLEQDKIDSVNF